MDSWRFLTNHARALVCIAHDPGVRLLDIAQVLGVSERRAFGIVTDLTKAGYVVKEKDGRRNRYRIQHHLRLRQAIGREPTIGELLAILVDTEATEAARAAYEIDGSDGRSRRTEARRTRSTKPG